MKHAHKTAIETAPAPAAKGHILLLPFEVKADSLNDADRTFGGQAAAFSLDLGGDVIEKGAFKRTITDWKRSKRVLPLLDSHSAYGTIRAVIGKVLSLAESDSGLDMTASVIDGPDGDEVWRRLKGGYVDGLSIGYKAIQSRAPTDMEALQGVWRFLKEVALKEISVCVWPMNPDARVDLATVKALLAEAKSRTLDADELDELKSVAQQIKALLEGAAPGETNTPAPVPTALAIEDPRRIALAASVRNLNLRRLTA